MSVRNVIEVENLSKKYILGETRLSTARIGEKVKHVNKNDDRVNGNVFWALRNVNLSVKQGEVLGIVGKNGAGKSTLLKLLSHITTPTSGKIKMKGSFASLLEVGTGFHPDLTGRENVYLNGAILGLTKAEINTHLESIIEFSGIQHHIDSPVKRYSSGMKVRLGFAVAAHLTPDILIIDEVLAVGDIEFQAKCLGKIGEVTESGRTVLFVSHNMAAVRSLCSSAALIHNGTVTAFGDTASVIEKYIIPVQKEANSGFAEWTTEEAPGSEEVTLLSVKTVNEKGETTNSMHTSQPVRIEISYRVTEKLWGSRIMIQLKDILDVTAFTGSSQLDEKPIKEPGVYTTTCIVPANVLNAGVYKVYVYMDIPNKKELIRLTHALSFNTVAMGFLGSIHESWEGLVAPELKWLTDKTNS